MTPTVNIENELSLEQESFAVRGFFSTVLGLDPEDCFISEDSQLSDFSFRGRGYTNHLGMPLSTLHTNWDQWILEQLSSQYGVEVSSTQITLPRLFHLLNSVEQTQRLLH
jgi:hypothetical protein